MDAVMVRWHLDEAWDGCQQHFTNPKNIHYGKKRFIPKLRNTMQISFTATNQTRSATFITIHWNPTWSR